MQNEENFLKFKKILNFAYDNKYSDFYRTKYKKTGFNPHKNFDSIDDIKKIPFLEKKELLEIDPYKFLFVDEKEIITVKGTSGTTGKSVFFFRSTRMVPPSMYGKRCLILYHPSLVHNITRNFVDSDNWMIVGDIHNIPASLQMGAELKIDTIVTNPSLAIILNNYLHNYPDLKKSLKRFILGGENVGLQKKSFLQKLYPDTKIFLMYGASEYGHLAIQCQNLAERLDKICYHPQINVYNIEIIDPESEKEVSFGERGEIILTSFCAEASPIIRYKTGDIGSLESSNCSCGLPGPLLQSFGRTNYDIVKAGGIEFKTDMLEGPMLNLNNYIRDSFEIHVSETFLENKSKVKLSIDLSLRDGVKESVQLKQQIENELLNNWQLSPRLNLKMAIEAGVIDNIQINFVQFPKSLKPRRFFILNQP